MNAVGEKNSIKNELIDIDRLVDSGVVSDTNLIRRAELHRKLHDINSREAKDFIQKSKLAIRGIFDDGIWCTNPIKVKEAFFNYFEARFKKPDIHRLVLNFTFDKRLSIMQAADLDRVVSRDEIRLAILEFLLGSDLCDAIEHFFDTRVFPNGCNSSFVALIPKVLANRLALVISDLISDTQSAFVANRQILDGPFILNELLHWCKRKKKQAIFFKVDFAKAYGSVRWDYLLDVLEAFSFGGNWCNWIRGTFSFAKASILVNGSPTSEFPFYCGLKQGDPLSPYLFILVMESLHLSFTRAINEGVFKGIQLHGSTYISHLFYADDAMFIGEWSDANLKGVMVGECMSSLKAWSPTLVKLRSRLSSWKVRTLSIGGRLTLLKAVLGASPLYYLSIFKVPKAILNSMEAVRTHCKKRIGNGGDTRFWHDHWLGDQPLRIRFPRLFALEMDKEVVVAIKMQDVASVSFRGIWTCDLTGDGEFRVKEIRNSLDNLFLPSHVEPTRWVKCIPIKINVFAWKRIGVFSPTRDLWDKQDVCRIVGHIATAGKYLWINGYQLVNRVCSLDESSRALNSAANKEEPVRRGAEAGARDSPSDGQHPDGWKTQLSKMVSMMATMQNVSAGVKFPNVVEGIEEYFNASQSRASDIIEPTKTVEDEANEEGPVDQNVELSPVLMYIGRKVDVVRKIESTMHEAYNTRHSTRLTEKKSAKKMVKKDSGKAVCIIYGR
ncbi:RNA-directed DNA polymerase, eukaryota [Tanacetum coccineum]